MGNIKIRDIFLLFLALSVFLNFFYYKYFFSYNKMKITSLNNEIAKLNKQLNLEAEIFYRDIKVFEMIAQSKKEIQDKEFNLWYLKRNIDLDDNFSNVIKQILIDSDIKISSVSLSEKRKDGNKNIYNFNLKFKTNQKNLLSMLDAIENNKKPMFVNSIAINPSGNDLNIDMVLTLVTMGS